MTEIPLWITEAEVVSMINVPKAIEALERILPMEAQAQAGNMKKGVLMVGENDAMHVIGASVAGAGLCGFKTWVNIRGKSSTVMVLFSMENGACEAVIEATALGQTRTAAMTGVGAKRLAPAGADDMAIIGTGKQALPQIAACAAVLPLKKLRIFSRSVENRKRLADAVRAQFDLDITLAETLEDAVADAPVITLVTNSTQPFLTSDMVTPGAHINAMGAIVLARSEFSTDIFPRCDLVAVDNPATIQSISSEFRDYYGDDEERWNEVATVASLIEGDITRPAAADLTLFKAMGMGLSDMALAVDILARAREQGLGHKVPERIKTPPRLI
ncbi:MAG: ornithine cyclodeaminase family protein [Pseudomonadota bacterium]|nr:ornithine cyclodeaminase family protein [Pseudomonadota bacterium]